MAKKTNTWPLSDVKGEFISFSRKIEEVEKRLQKNLQSHETCKNLVNIIIFLVDLRTPSEFWENTWKRIK